jgi:hypothetical protein
VTHKAWKAFSEASACVFIGAQGFHLSASGAYDAAKAMTIKMVIEGDAYTSYHGPIEGSDARACIVFYK